MGCRLKSVRLIRFSMREKEGSKFMKLEVGIKGIEKVTVKKEMLAKSMDSGAAEVFATPWMIALMEGAAQNSVSEAVGEGNITVGSRVDIVHLSPTPLGAEVWAESELIGIDGRKLTFQVCAYDKFGKIGEGTHDRHIVDYQRFMSKCNGKKES